MRWQPNIPPVHTHLDFESVTEQLVLKTLSGINISKPLGVVGINSKVLKEALVYLSTEFIHSSCEFVS